MSESLKDQQLGTLPETTSFSEPKKPVRQFVSALSRNAGRIGQILLISSSGAFGVTISTQNALADNGQIVDAATASQYKELCFDGTNSSSQEGCVPACIIGGVFDSCDQGPYRSINVPGNPIKVYHVATITQPTASASGPDNSQTLITPVSNPDTSVSTITPTSSVNTAPQTSQITSSADVNKPNNTNLDSSLPKPSVNNLPNNPATELPQSSHIALNLYPQDMAKLKDPAGLLAKFDTAYNSMQNLMGYAPYSGVKIQYQEVNLSPQYVLLSGNPVQWSATYVPSDIDSVNNHNDALWGNIHELGHDFDQNTGWAYIGGGMINPEFWASFKAAYTMNDLQNKFPGAMVKLNDYDPNKYVPVGQIDETYFIDDKANTYLSNPNPSWTQSTDADILIGLLLKTENKTGWDPFIKTMHAYSSFNHSLPPTTDDQKINIFIYLLSKNSGTDVAGQFAKWGFPTTPSNQDIAAKWVNSAQG